MVLFPVFLFFSFLVDEFIIIISIIIVFFWDFLWGGAGDPVERKSENCL